MSLTPEQARAAHAAGSVAVTAGAGTGKTHMLAERYLHHLESHGHAPLEVAAVTFTEKAAAELRARIRSRVAEALPDRPEWLAELEAAPISTIHALAARVCKEHPGAAGVVPDFAVLDEQEGQLWMADRMLEAINELPERIFGVIPYTLLVAALGDLLKDPQVAAWALEQSPGDYEAIARRTRENELELLLESPAWQDAAQTVRAFSGDAACPIESQRQIALAGLALISQSPQEGLLALAGIALRGGSEKRWPGGGLTEVKEALKTLRDTAKDARKDGLVLLSPGPSDERLKAMIPVLKEAYEAVSGAIAEAKRQARLLDFSDLEVHALKALEHEEVQAYYACRWKAFLIDEFQDTNAIQAKIVERLTTNATLTVVGDEKQSIYGFRRADVAVFQRLQAQIAKSGGAREGLSTSFRTHDALIRVINQVFSPVLGAMHQDLAASRTEPPHPGPHVRAFRIEAERGVPKPDRQRAEARRLARELKAMLDAKTPVHDKPSREMRPIRYGDIAVLARVWAPLEIYGEALAAEGIPFVHAGGGDLMATREALDGWALLRFLADPRDNLALAAVLRSPFFAVSDRALFAFARRLERGACWWRELEAQCPPELAHAFEILGQLLRRKRLEPPSRLLLAADALTGYTAVLANMPGARRREADWRGFSEAVRQLEDGAQDVFHVVRRLKRLLDAEVALPRPPLEVEDAVALMTIHAAKGLEWPVVVVPDLARSAPGQDKKLFFDPELGAALKLELEDDEVQPVLTTVLMRQQGRLEKEERKRVFYVALTRARDHLLLGATDEKGGAMDFLVPGFEAAGVPVEVIPFDPQDARPESPSLPEAPPEPTRLLLHAVGPGLVELPVTALSEFQRCPKRFKLQYLDGHPGLPEGSGYAARVGTLVHLALEQGLDTASDLKRFDPTLPPEAIDDAVALVRRFQEEACYQPFRGTIRQREHTFRLKLGRLVLNGIVDGVGDDYVLDYKTDREIHPEHHRFQVWAYAEALGKPRAHLAYLRHGHVETYESEALVALGAEARQMAEAILEGPYPARPMAAMCTRCPYGTVCEEQAAHAPVEAVSPFLPGLREELPLGVPSPQEWEQVVVRAEGAEAWRLAQIAPGRHAAALLARLAASGWTPEDAVRHAAFQELCRLAAACEPGALEAMPQADGVSLRLLTDTGPYAISAEDLALVEAYYGPMTLEAAQRAWVDFWLALARWHHRFEAQVEERLEEVAEVSVAPLLEEA